MVGACRALAAEHALEGCNARRRCATGQGDLVRLPEDHAVRLRLRVKPYIALLSLDRQQGILHVINVYTFRCGRQPAPSRIALASIGWLSRGGETEDGALGGMTSLALRTLVAWHLDDAKLARDVGAPSRPSAAPLD